MSVEAIGWVFARSPMKGAAFAVHVAVADSVNDNYENEFWMRTPKLARKARLSRGAADKALAALCTEGLLELLEEGRPGPRSTGAPRRYLFLMPDLPLVYESRSSDATPKVSRRGRDTSRVVGATPPVDTSLPLTQGKEEPRAGEKLEPLYGFEHFWGAWPPRNGKKLSRGKAEDQWKRLDLDERKAAWRGAVNYARASALGLQGAMDAFRWLRDRAWEDWQTPASPEAKPNGNGRAPRTPIADHMAMEFDGAGNLVR